MSVRRNLACLIGGAALVVLAGAGQTAPRFGEHLVGRVHAVSGRSAVDHGSTLVRAARSRCIGVDTVAGAVVFGDRAVELTMKNGAQWRMSFARSCPALSFYQGFYYRRAVAGRLCARRDAVIARSGGECPIDTIVRVRAPLR